MFPTKFHTLKLFCNTGIRYINLHIKVIKPTKDFLCFVLFLMSRTWGNHNVTSMYRRYYMHLTKCPVINRMQVVDSELLPNCNYFELPDLYIKIWRPVVPGWVSLLNAPAVTSGHDPSILESSPASGAAFFSLLVLSGSQINKIF